MRGYLELLRPANVVTATADVLAGFAVAGRAYPAILPWLVVSTMCLYAGGVVLNDYFDRELDAVERPERPIPSGRVAPKEAVCIGTALLAAGIGAALAATRVAGIIAVSIAALAVFYDAGAKRHPIVGPLNMGLVRGLNVVLGMAVLPAAVVRHWSIGLLSLVYIMSVTMVSRGEVHGGSTTVAAVALASLGTVLAALGVIAFRADGGQIAAMVLIAVLAWRVLPPVFAVCADPRPTVVRRAVRTGVLSLVLLDAAVSAVYAGALYAGIVLATGLVAGLLARMFSVA